MRLSALQWRAHASQLVAWSSLLWFYLRSRPFFTRVLWLSVAVLWTASWFIGGYVYSRHHFDGLMSGFEPLSERYNLPYQGVSWAARFSALQRYVEISDQTKEEMKLYLYEKEEKISELEEQLYFYRTVIAPEDSDKGLSIFSLQLEQVKASGAYSFQVVLRNHQSKQGTVKGRIKVSIDGEHIPAGGRMVRDNLLVDEMKFSFRYFQRLKGLLHLPEQFIPRQVSVMVDSNKFQDVEKTYAWNELIN